MRKRNKSKIIINRFKRKLNTFFKKYKKIIITSLVILVFLFWLNISYKKYIDNEKNIITNVFFDKKIINNPNLYELIKSTQTTFSWQNSVKNKIFWFKKEKKEITQNFKFISNIDVKIINNKSIKIKYYFKKPLLSIIWSWNIFSVYNKNDIYKFNKNFLSWINIQNTWYILYLPKYLENTDIDKYIFWKNSLNRIMKVIKVIKTYFPKWKIYYIAWWENLKLKIKDKNIYFSLSSDIEKQLNKLNLIKTKLIDKYNNAKNIDLWNLNEWVFLDWYKN